jgi:hypothetical protein
MAEERFRRGQVERALWSYFGRHFGAPIEPPTLFRTRLKRLLEVDRTQEKIYASEVPHARYAFIDGPPSGTGIDLSYSAFNAFCLGVAYDLLDAGLKQSDVVFLVRNLRRDLAQEFTWMARSPIVPRMKTPASERPNCPTFTENGTVWADCRVFVVIEKVELEELKPTGLSPDFKEESLVFQPKFLRGGNALAEELRTMNFDYRKALVLELAHTAQMVTEALKTAPAIRRGRQ